MATVLYSQATPTPREIRVNMFRLRLTMEDQPRWKNGQPPHSTTGLANMNSITCSGRTLIKRWVNAGARSAAMAMTKTGSARTRPIQKRRLMSRSSALSSSASAATGSRAIPQMGQSPGSSRTISGCMGQVYRVLLCACGSAGSRAMPHMGQLPGSSFSTPGHMGQI